MISVVLLLVLGAELVLSCPISSLLSLLFPCLVYVGLMPRKLDGVKVSKVLNSSWDDDKLLVSLVCQKMHPTKDWL